MKKPLIFDYNNIGFFLNACYRYRKINERNFSYDKWALELKITSRSYLRLLVIGKRPLPDKLIPQFCENLRLSDTESNFFTLLTKYDSCKTVQTKEIVGRQLIQAQQSHLESTEVTNTEHFFMDPLAPIVFSILSEKTIQKDTESIAKICMLDSVRTQKILNTLVKVNLIKAQISKQGLITYLALSSLFKVPDNPADPFIESFHVEGLKQAFEAKSLPFEKRRFRSLLFNLNHKDMETAQLLINDFAAKILNQFSAKSHDAFEVYRLNLQLFPVTQEIHTSSDQSI